MPDRPWIGYVYVDPEVELKLRTKHNLTGDQIRRAICWGAHDEAVWDHDPVYGLRLVVTGSTTETGPLIAYLEPLSQNDGDWECLTAWRLS